MTFYENALASQQRERAIQTQQINGARPATQILTQVSIGVGNFRLVEPLSFDVPFTDEPVFTQGAALQAHPSATLWYDPVGVAGIRGWQRDDRGHFIGVFCYFSVTMQPVDVDLAFTAYPEVTMIHNLVFFGVAYKPLPKEVRSEMETIEARPVMLGIN